MKKTSMADQLMLEMRLLESEDAIIEMIEKVDDIEITDRDGRTFLHNASGEGLLKVIVYLLAHGASINQKDKQGYTPLHAAVIRNHWTVVRYLLENGADVHARDAWGGTPLMRLSHLAPLEMFKMLLDYGADPLSVNNYGVVLIDSFEAYPDIHALLKEYANRQIHSDCTP